MVIVKDFAGFKECNPMLLFVRTNLSGIPFKVHDIDSSGNVHAHRRAPTPPCMARFSRANGIEMIVTEDAGQG
jgi:hypothetical protein